MKIEEIHEACLSGLGGISSLTIEVSGWRDEHATKPLKMNGYDWACDDIAESIRNLKSKGE